MAAPNIQGPTPQATAAAEATRKAQAARDEKQAGEAASAKAKIDKHALRAFGKGVRLHGVKITGSFQDWAQSAEGKAKIEAALDDYIMVESLGDSSRFAYRGTCRECAWQCHAQSRSDAVTNVSEHAKRHLYQV